MAIDTYDPRLRAIRDNDLVFWDGAGLTWNRGPTIASATSSGSDTVDLGSANIFANIPVCILFEATATVSALSQNSTPLTLDKQYIPGFWLQDASDGSTFSDIAFVKWPCDASFACTATLFNSMTLGVVNVRRYLRLYQKCGVGTSGAIRAWLRMGLTA